MDSVLSSGFHAQVKAHIVRELRTVLGTGYVHEEVSAQYILL